MERIVLDAARQALDSLQQESDSDNEIQLEGVSSRQCHIRILTAMFDIDENRRKFKLCICFVENLP
jgi:hypothetical protein